MVSLVTLVSPPSGISRRRTWILAGFPSKNAETGFRGGLGDGGPPRRLWCHLGVTGHKNPPCELLTIVQWMFWKSYLTGKILTFPNAASAYLTRLKNRHPRRITTRESNGRTLWCITQAPEASARVSGSSGSNSDFSPTPGAIY